MTTDQHRLLAACLQFETRCDAIAYAADGGALSEVEARREYGDALVRHRKALAALHLSAPPDRA
jgi:hypothetical protein